ncbi:MAG: hypothetical protein EP298_05720 [Gammaproteobacteria bacterium]|nr:MAG: hypothetical protein EP298_05720 [Gammaproteobacteria bacterium]UTW41446.1 hypothetical protein KFE69_07950 [bacterium SCSIO 12844]
MNNIKITTSHPTIVPQYEFWGLGKLLTKPKCEPLNTISDDFLNIANQFVNDDNFKLSTIKFVSFNTDCQKLNAILIRYSKQPEHLNAEHISILINQSTHQLLGLTKQIKQSQNKLPTHKLAYEKAIVFLNQYAHDLVAEKPILNLPSCNSDQRLEFNPVIVIDNIQLHWIDQHQEIITIDNKKCIINGLKIKCYIPKIDRWAWVIVDYYGNIITFERNIHWDFNKHQRLTPMWLHDQWLVNHKLG